MAVTLPPPQCWAAAPRPVGAGREAEGAIPPPGGAEAKLKVREPGCPASGCPPSAPSFVISGSRLLLWAFVSSPAKVAAPRVPPPGVSVWLSKLVAVTCSEGAFSVPVVRFYRPSLQRPLVMASSSPTDTAFPPPLLCATEILRLPGKAPALPCTGPGFKPPALTAPGEASVLWGLYHSLCVCKSHPGAVSPRQQDDSKDRAFCPSTPSFCLHLRTSF